MSTRNITYSVCDGCGRNDLNDGIEIIQHEARRMNAELYGMADLCIECAQTKYICHWCWRVHDDEHACERVKAFVAEEAQA